MNSRFVGVRRALRFVEVAASSRVWLIATTIFVAAVSYLARVVVTLPDALATHHAAVMAIETELEEQKRIPEIAGAIIEVVKKSVDVTRDYADLMGQSLSPPTQPAVSTEQFKRLVEARMEVQGTVGLLHGIKFSDSMLQEQASRLEAAIASFDRDFQTIEALYLGLLRGEEAKTLHLQAAPGLLAHGERRRKELESAFLGFRGAATAADKRNLAESERLVGRRRVQFLQLALAVFAVIFCVGYAGAIVYGLRSYRDDRFLVVP